MKFLHIYNETEENLRLALLSLWAPGKHPMRPAIERLFKEEPLITEPVFQSMFGWEPVSNDEWKSYFNPDFYDKLKIGEQHLPYKHQAESWKHLRNGKSIIVTSGTGSGKTECFMYPVLNDLYEQGASNAIQALFLYPLNALMEDQKSRLSRYCKATGLSYAVYNGDTPEFRLIGDLLPNEVGTRDEIRDSKGKGTRPQILLTNPSMLEYILVRQKDQMMLQESGKKLRWIVIDEAHNYSGSAAVELAYQIKRILEAFDVKSEEVRFACTSATIGGEDGKQSLTSFISTIIGQKESQIVVIGGNRHIPHIDSKRLNQIILDNRIPIDARLVLSLRDKINKVSGMSLRQLWEWLCIRQDFNIQNALKLVDLLCEIKIDDISILSLRAHFFMRAISGLYACSNDDCPGTSNTAFGHLTTYKAAVCPNCGYPLLELVQCKRCNSFILMGKSDSQTHQINTFEDNLNNDDYFALDEDDDGTNDTICSYPDVFFIIPYNERKFNNPNSKAQFFTMDIVHEFSQSTLEVNKNNSGKWVEVRKDARHSFCPFCGQLAYGKRLRFKFFRIPIDFINQTITPVFLKECASEGHMWGKYIAFTDSRQGTAISAKTFNIDVERRICRERVMSYFSKCEHEDHGAVIDLNSPQFASLDEETKTRIAQILNEQAEKQSSITLDQASSLIFDERLFDHIAGYDRSADKAAYKASLMRNFIGIRRLYENGPENMGLIILEYPALKDVRMPEVLVELAEKRNRVIEDQDWRDFLKISLDYFVRQNNHIQSLIPGERKFIRDASLSTPISANDDIHSGVSRWISVKAKNNESISDSQNRLVVLLCAALGIDTIEKLKEYASNIDLVLSEAWNILIQKKILTCVEVNDHEGYNNPKYYPNNQYVGCYYLDLSFDDKNTICRIKKTKKVWVCPVTGTLLDTIFCGYSPLMVGELSSKLFERYKCKGPQIEMPSRPKDNSEVTNWLLSDRAITDLKEKGLWTDLYKYVYISSPVYLAAEHSAQQSKDLLREYTKSFSAKNPGINVLHCSTTMELGVDIGDIDVVLMDTVPPTAANYLQRAGRAGRKKQTKAIAFSLCNNTPVGQHAFDNPMWALQTPNHMIPLRSSQTIIQRHINSFFFRQFVCVQSEGIQATTSVGNFMDSLCNAFINFLEDLSSNQAMVAKFRKTFGHEVRYTINITKQCIINIQSEFKGIIQELLNAIAQYQDDERRAIAISNQIKNVKQESLLNYLTENQFLPNASMPTGVVTFDFTDKEQSKRLFKLYNELERYQREYDSCTSEPDKIIIRQTINNTLGKINSLRRATQATREIHTALNEYAPEQTIVVNEKNYVSAGIMLFGAYNEATKTKAIYHCKYCGKTEYLPIRDEHRLCTHCHNPYRSILADRNECSYTLAYEPIGFRTDQNIDSSREEKTYRRYYEIRPVLLKFNWTSHIDVNMCQVTTSGETGEILFCNVGNGSGFAFCKKCGRATIELSSFEEELPISIRPGHKRLWGDYCDSGPGDIVRNVVFTGRHQTCYSVLRFVKINSVCYFEKDKELVFSLGVILKRALVEFLGIDETEVDFGYKEELEDLALVIFDTARGGCGYSLHFNSPVECKQIFALALRKLSEYSCNCHVDGGACVRCLVDRSNYRYAYLLSKRKVLEWLRNQGKRKIL